MNAYRTLINYTSINIPSDAVYSNYSNQNSNLQVGTEAVAMTTRDSIFRVRWKILPDRCWRP